MVTHVTVGKTTLNNNWFEVILRELLVMDSGIHEYLAFIISFSILN